MIGDKTKNRTTNYRFNKEDGIRMIRGIKDYRTILIALLFISISGLRVFAQPAVRDVSGTISNGSSITIAGSGFGTKATAAPVKWDNFENGTVGADLTTLGWSHYAGGGTSPYAVVSNTDHYGQGSNSARKNIAATIEDFTGHYFSGFNGATEAYVSLMFKWDTTDGSTPSGGGIFKWLRMNTKEVYRGVPSFGQTYQPGWLYEYYNSNGTLNQFTSSSAPPKGTWSRMEMRWKLSNPGGTANGMAESWVNLVKNMNQVNVVTRPSGDSSPIYSFLLPIMCSGAGENYKIVVDDVYIDNTVARVEIGNASTWAASTKRELQIPTAWSDTSITVKANQGSLGSLQTAYLYIVDANGNVNANGYPLSGATTTTTTATIPNPPLSLVVK